MFDLLHFEINHQILEHDQMTMRKLRHSIAVPEGLGAMRTRQRSNLWLRNRYELPSSNNLSCLLTIGLRLVSSPDFSGIASFVDENGEMQVCDGDAYLDWAFAAEA